MTLIHFDNEDPYVAQELDRALDDWIERRAEQAELLDRHGPAATDARQWRQCQGCGASCIGFPCALCGSER
jgi:hypothetical protein